MSSKDSPTDVKTLHDHSPLSSFPHFLLLDNLAFICVGSRCAAKHSGGGVFHLLLTFCVIDKCEMTYKSKCSHRQEGDAFPSSSLSSRGVLLYCTTCYEAHIRKDYKHYYQRHLRQTDKNTCYSCDDMSEYSSPPFRRSPPCVSDWQSCDSKKWSKIILLWKSSNCDGSMIDGRRGRGAPWHCIPPPPTPPPPPRVYSTETINRKTIRPPSKSIRISGVPVVPTSSKSAVNVSNHRISNVTCGDMPGQQNSKAFNDLNITPAHVVNSRKRILPLVPPPPVDTMFFPYRNYDWLHLYMHKRKHPSPKRHHALSTRSLYPSTDTTDIATTETAISVEYRKLIDICKKYDRKQLVSFLRLNFFNLKLLLNSKNRRSSEDGWYPLHYAVRDVAMVQILLAYGADPNVVDNGGYTPLHIACSNGYTHTVATLVKTESVNVNSGASEGTRPLHCSVFSQDVALVQLLLTHGASVEQKDDHGNTALDVAMVTGAHQIAEELRVWGEAALV